MNKQDLLNSTMTIQLVQRIRGGWNHGHCKTETVTVQEAKKQLATQQVKIKDKSLLDAFRIGEWRIVTGWGTLSQLDEAGFNW